MTSAVPPGNPEWFRIALGVAQDFRPITEAETGQLMGYLGGAEPLFP